MTDRGTKGMLAGGGGNATASGVRFQAEVGALFAARMLAELPLDPRLDLPATRIRSVRFETRAPLDDILVETEAGGFIAIQVKSGLDFGRTLATSFGSVVDQIARHWAAANSGSVDEAWARPIDPALDRLVLVVGSQSSRLVGRLGQALGAGVRAGITDSALSDARETFIGLVRQAWDAIGYVPQPREMERLLSSVSVLVVDTEGSDRLVAVEQLRAVAADSADADALFVSIADAALDAMRRREGVDAAMLRAHLSARGQSLDAPISLVGSVAALRTYSLRVADQLAGYERLSAGDLEISIERDCLPDVVEAAREGSLVVIGEPGAGKSAVLNALARSLRNEGADVIELAVDRLPVSGLDALTQELGLAAPVLEVLRNWPGVSPAYLVIDALDATRGGPSETVFRALVDGVLGIEGDRWRVVASIRTFDLRMGRQFRQLFVGDPVAGLADPSFPDVRHVSVPVWTDHEFDTILGASPGLATALEAAGPRLQALARTPFNTRLLADLLSRGTEPRSFSGVTSQSRLLSRYWRDRVEVHGGAAEASLRQIVARMVQDHALRAPRAMLDAGAAAAVEPLERDGVVVRSGGERYLAFRHHILFDYAASRLYLDPYDLELSVCALSSRDGAALGLAQALGFALDEAWEQDIEGRGPFWRVAGTLMESEEADPIASMVAARLGSELPRSPDDVSGLLQLLGGPEEREAGRQAVRHLLGALSVRAEDNPQLSVEPWTALATGLAERLRPTDMSLAGALRLLLHVLVKRLEAPAADPAAVGEAARKLLEASIDFGADQHVPLAIEYVTKLYDTDPPASRRSLSKLLQPERLAAHAADDMHWLARGSADIAASDPAFLAQIYHVVFNYRVTDQSSVPLGSSQILALTTNPRQNYDLARYGLKEHFPTFLAEHPEQAVDALVSAIEGQVREEGRDLALEPVEGFSAGGRQVELVRDHSYIWANDPEDEYPQDAEALLQTFVKQVKAAAPHLALRLATLLLERAKFAILWSRLLHVAAARVDVLGDLIWPFASSTTFLTTDDTLKDAIDAVAAAYPSRSRAERASFEQAAFTLRFEDRRDPEAATRFFRTRLFTTIGAANLVTPEAKAAVQGVTEAASEPNERLFRVWSETSSMLDRGRLALAGVNDPTAEEMALFEQVDAIFGAFALEEQRVPAAAPSELLDAVESLKAAIDATRIRNPLVLAYASDPIVKACHSLVANGGRPLDRVDNGFARITALVRFLAGQASPEIDEDTESLFERSAGWGSPAPRVDAAGLLYDLIGIDPALVDELLPVLQPLLHDPHPAVRLAAVQRLTAFWTDRRDWMWDRVRQVAAEETNHNVLRYFTSYVLGRLTFAVEDVSPILHQLWRKHAADGDASGKALKETLAEVLAALWVWRADAASGEVVRSLVRSASLDDGVARHVVSITRAALTSGYEDGERADARERAQALLAEAIEGPSARLEAFFAAPAWQRDQEAARRDAQALDHAFMQIYFAAGVSGVSSDRDALSDSDARLRFLCDVEPLLRRAGDVGTPRTIHHLVELADHMLSAAPELAFDLAAHAVLTAGRTQGYHLESMGAQLFARFIGRSLADQRGLFDDPVRRQQLIACLDVFIDGGWPAARRLLYQLPELLQ